MTDLASSSRRTCILTTVAAVLALAGCSAPRATISEPGSAPGPQPRVLFQGQGETHLLVGTASLDGSEITYPLEDLPGGDQTNPDWSPDGSRMAFVVDDGARDDLWTADADGSHPGLLLDCAGPCRRLDDPAWSSDGSEVVYSRTTARGSTGLGSLESIDVTTGEVTTILPPRFRRFTAGARWAPDGSAVVYESVHTVGRALDADVDGIVLRILDTASHRPGRPLTDPWRFAGTADWSPDGTRIAYAALAAPGADAADLFVMPADRGAPRQVTHLARSGGFANEPTWSADNVTLVFSGRLDGGFGGPAVLLGVDTSTGRISEPGARTVIGRHPRIAPTS